MTVSIGCSTFSGSTNNCERFFRFAIAVRVWWSGNWTISEMSAVPVANQLEAVQLDRLAHAEWLAALAARWPVAHLAPHYATLRFCPLTSRLLRLFCLLLWPAHAAAAAPERAAARHRAAARDARRVARRGARKHACGPAQACSRAGAGRGAARRRQRARGGRARRRRAARATAAAAAAAARALARRCAVHVRDASGALCASQ